MTLNNLSLATSTGFQLTSNNCGTSLAPGASCTTGIVFQPTVAGMQNGNLTVTASTLANPVTAAFRRGLRLYAGRFRLHQPNRNQRPNCRLYPCPYATEWFGGHVHPAVRHSSYVCHLLLQSNQPIALDAGTTGYLTVSISTGHSTSSANRETSPPWRTLALACGLILLPLGGRRSQRFCCQSFSP